MIKPMYGRGFARMKARLGPEESEKLRLKNIKDQEAALSEAGKHRVAKEQRDRETYVTYPKPKRRKS